MKAKRVYTGEWGSHNMSPHTYKSWFRRWTRLSKKAERLRFKHTGQHTFSLYTGDFPKVTTGTIIRVVIEELVEDAESG